MHDVNGRNGLLEQNREEGQDWEGCGRKISKLQNGGRTTWKKCKQSCFLP